MDDFGVGPERDRGTRSEFTAESARRALGFSVVIPVIVTIGLVLNFLTRWALFVALPLAVLLMALGSHHLVAAKRANPELLVPGIGFEQTLSSKGYIRFYSSLAGISFKTASRIIWGAWLFPVGFFMAIIVKGVVVSLRP